MGLGMGALASQLGAVTVSAVDDSFSAEVGGLQNTATNLAASLGVALIGSVLIATLTTAAAAGIQDNPAIPDSVKTQASTHLVGSVPFLSDTQLTDALVKAGASEVVAASLVDVNAQARLDALRAAFALAALLAAGALFFTGRLPEVAPGAPAPAEPAEPAGV